MSHRIAYAPPADDTLAKMSDAEELKDVMERTLGLDPYGHGSTVIGQDPERREATVRGVITRYYVSASILTVTVVRMIPSP